MTLRRIATVALLLLATAGLCAVLLFKLLDHGVEIRWRLQPGREFRYRYECTTSVADIGAERFETATHVLHTMLNRTIETDADDITHIEARYESVGVCIPEFLRDMYTTREPWRWSMNGRGQHPPKPNRMPGLFETYLATLPEGRIRDQSRASGPDAFFWSEAISFAHFNDFALPAERVRLGAMWSISWTWRNSTSDRHYNDHYTLRALQGGVAVIDRHRAIQDTPHIPPSEVDTMFSLPVETTVVRFDVTRGILLERRMVRQLTMRLPDGRPVRSHTVEVWTLVE